MAVITCFGELLLRLSAPAPQLLLQSPHFEVFYAGAEANAAVSLAQFGHEARFASRLPDNGLGRATINELRRWGVDTRFVSLAPGRMGLYFHTHGAAMRPSEITYDRAGSAFALLEPHEIDWSQALAGADWLHVTGVTPALGQRSTEAAHVAVRAARARGVKVSFDCNYRAKLWALWPSDGPAILRTLISEADLLFGDHRDMGLILGFKTDETDPMAQRRDAADEAFAAFPNLSHMASTHRLEKTVNDHDLTGFLLARDGQWTSDTIAISPIVDRIGGGDAYAAGVLHGIAGGKGPEYAVRFAAAAAALKHTVPGDFNLVTIPDVEATMAGGSLSVRR